jgi:hypothetical protein
MTIMVRRPRRSPLDDETLPLTFTRLRQKSYPGGAAS